MCTESKGNFYFRTPSDPKQMPKFHQATKDNTITINDTTGYSEEPMIYEALDESSVYVAPVTASRVSHGLGPEPQYYEVPSQHITPAAKADDDSEQPQLYLDVISIDNEDEIYTDIPNMVEQVRQLQNKDNQKSDD